MIKNISRQIVSPTGACSFIFPLHRFGRKIVIFVSLMGMLVFGFIGSFIPSYWPFLFTRFIVGIFKAGAGVQMFIYISEYVGHKYRPAAGIGMFMFFTVGLAAVGLKAFFIREWKMLFIVCTAPYIFVVAFAK